MDTYPQQYVLEPVHTSETGQFYSGYWHISIEGGDNGEIEMGK